MNLWHLCVLVVYAHFKEYIISINLPKVLQQQQQQYSGRLSQTISGATIFIVSLYVQIYHLLIICNYIQPSAS